MYRHDNQEIRSLGCEYHEELNNTHENGFPKLLSTEIMEPCFVAAVVELLATASTDKQLTITSKVRSCATANTSFGWIQSTKLENNPCNSETQKGIVNSETCPSISELFHDTEVVMMLREQYVGHMFSHSWKMLNILEL